MVNICTDSTADLSKEQIAKNCLSIIPLTVTIDGKAYQDQVDITISDLFQAVEQSGYLPKTSAPSIAEFVSRFSIPGDILYIGISSQLSGAYQHSALAAEMVENKDIRLIDSLNISTGIGLLVLKAAELRDLGKTLDEIESEIRKIIPKVRTSFTIDTLDYLYLGGRCSAMQNIVSSLLKIRPIIEIHPDGTLGVKDKIRGSRSKALNSMLDSFKDNLNQIDLQRVFITHTGCEEDAAFLQAELTKIAPIQEICITTTGCTVASHCGPNTIGILYLEK
jgi:DegV family protein with EDD domain